MGQTLTHGVYLPDEGERNCYNGLAGNWQLLDGAVGTVAEHTTALAGKAPAVHTHTKSDVTDLLNSNFIPSTNNSYDLGSSSYQWNNLYAKNYFYNGVAWGLDKDNVWTGSNTISDATNSVFYFKFGTSGSYSDIRWKDNNDSHYATLRSKVDELILGLQYSSASAWYSGASVNINNNGSVKIKAYDGTEAWTVNFTPLGVYPTSSNALELGASTNKWKTLNGINPGALSLPDVNNADPIDFSQWDVSGAPWINNYTPTENGWLMIRITDRATNSIYVFNTYGSNMSVYGNGAQNILGRLALLMPVIANVQYNIIITANSISDVSEAKFFPCLGNV